MLESLGNKSRKGLAWDVFGTVIKQISILAVTVVLARLLGPEEFGIIGMAMVFVSLTQVFIDVGFTDGIIQKAEISDIELSSVFYVNLFISIFLALLIYFSAGLIGGFYEEPAVTITIKYLSIIPVTAGLGRVHAALLAKKMRFRALTLRDIAATFSGGTVGVVVALNGHGIYALVCQQIVSTLVGTILLWIGSGWTPNRSFSFLKIKNLLSFSSFVFFDQALHQLFLKIDTLFIGKVFSAATLGFYSRAESLNAQVSNYTSSSLRKVIFPALSSVQDNDVKFKEIFFKVFQLAAFAGVISSGVLYFLSEEIIVGLLGEKWHPSVVIFQILVFRLLLAPFGPLMGKAMLAKGYSRSKFKVSLIQRVIMLTPLPIGYYLGIEAFTISLVLSNLVGLVINMFVMSYLFKFSVIQQLLIFFKPLIPFLILVLFFYCFSVVISGYILALIFLILQFSYSYLTKDKGAKLVFLEIIRIVKPIASKYKFIN